MKTLEPDLLGSTLTVAKAELNSRRIPYQVQFTYPPRQLSLSTENRVIKQYWHNEQIVLVCAYTCHSIHDPLDREGV